MKISLTITMDTETNAVSVTGPLHDRLLCYGLLAEAKQVVVAAQSTKAAPHPAIVRATELPKPPH